MPIRPKHVPGDGRPAAQRQFTDREDFIRVFRTALVAERPDRPSVLVFYGVGGIGKTSLRKELTRLLESEPGVVTAALDFEVPGHRDEDTALFVLRKLLHERYKVQFPSFDIAYAVHWQKTRPQTPLTRQNFPLLESGTVLADAVDVLGNLTVVGLIPKLAGMALKGSRAVRDWWTKRGSDELRDLPRMESSEIAERLPMFWASDFKDFLATRGSRAVLFLDTFEALTETERSEGKLYQRDEWVRELVSQLPGVLWVVCGREMLRWSELDADWKASLSQHLVGGLADEDARQFLKACGIEGRTIVDTIVSGSTGLPYCLDLAVDTYLEARRDGLEPKPEYFAHTPAEVFVRFLRHLTQPEIETLKVLAVPRFWNRELLELLVTRFNTGYPLTAFNDLCRFSFVNENAAAGTWTMHQLMRQSLQEHAAPELVGRVHRLLFEHYDNQLKEIDIRNITGHQRNALAEAFHHGQAHLPVQDFLEWFDGPSVQFYQAQQWRLLGPLWEQLVFNLEAELGPDDLTLADCLNNLGVMLYGEGEYAKSEQVQRRVLATREKVLGSEHPDVAQSLNNLAVLVQMRADYGEAELLQSRALAIREKTLGPEHPDVAVSLMSLSEVLRSQRRYAEAEPLALRGLAIMEKALGSEHPSVAVGLNNLANLQRAQDKHLAAERLYRRALAIREKALGAEHPEVATSLSNLASLLTAQGRYADSEPLHRRALAIRENALGPGHPLVAKVLEDLARLCDKTGREEEARALAERVRAIHASTGKK